MEIKPIADIVRRIRTIQFNEEFDLIVAIARGGLIPAAMLQSRLNLPLESVELRFRSDSQEQIFDEPKLLSPLRFDPAGKKILLVDDRSRTGSTFSKASELLAGASLIRTCAVNGSADYPLFDETCFFFPWRIDIYD